ncbi:MAG: hypothetical protein IIA73_07715 [Proteobacteria bacterium]|nr:hypothetical protein [Pseudomonadota bacterium]
MAAPVPAKEFIELHNKLLNLSFDEDLAEIEKIQWRLQTVVRRQPDNIGARVALIEAFRTGGNRADAVEQASHVSQYHSSLETQELETYLIELVGLGMYDRAKPLLDQGRATQRNASLSIAARCAAVASGDIPWLEQLGSHNDDTNEANRYLKILNGSGLAEHFRDHQGIVNGIVGPQQCGVAVSIDRDLDEPDDLAGIVTYFFVPKGRSERRELDRDLRAGLEEYYADRSLAPGMYIGHLHTMLTGVPFPVSRRG